MKLVADHGKLRKVSRRLEIGFLVYLLNLSFFLIVSLTWVPLYALAFFFSIYDIIDEQKEGRFFQ